MRMTIHSVVLQKLLSANAHLGRRVAAHHFKQYTYGLRNGMAIIDSDKTLISLRNACNFVSILAAQNARLMFVNTIVTERKSSVLLEAAKLQIPIVALVDSSMPWDASSKISYPVPANDSVQFVYLFCNMITKSILLEQKKLKAAKGGGQD